MVNDVLVKEPLGKSDHAVLSFFFEFYHIREGLKKTNTTLTREIMNA